MALTRKERTLGCLWAMACGDALGVPSSFLTPEQIKSKYGWIDTFYPPEKGHIFHDGLRAGEYTDDTEQSMALMNAYIRDKKVVPMSVVKEIIAWADRVKDKYASPLGPSTERALKNIAAGGDITVSGKWGNTNGSSMRIAPLGIIHGLRGSTLQELARDVALTDLATHNTRVCNAAATAIAWGVAQAMRGEENLDKIVDATIEAAAEGAKYGFSIPSPDIGMRIALACDHCAQGQGRPAGAARPVRHVRRRRPVRGLHSVGDCAVPAGPGRREENAGILRQLWRRLRYQWRDGGCDGRRDGGYRRGSADVAGQNQRNECLQFRQGCGRNSGADSPVACSIGKRCG